MKPNKKCVICGTEYEYCSSCSEKKHLPTWKNSFCSENCKIIYDTCVKYSMGNLEKEEAASILRSCDLSKRNKFTPSTKRLVKEILAQPKKAKPAEEPSEVI